MLAAAPAAAGTFLDDMRSSKGWTVTVGASGMATPTWEGSDKTMGAVLPLFNIRPIGTPPRYFNPREGLGVTLFEIGRLQIGPVAQIKFSRKVKDDPFALQGLGDVDLAIEAGAFAEYWFVDWLRYRAEVRQGFGGHHGVVADQFVDVVVPFGPWTLSAGPRLRIVSARANDPYYDINLNQSLLSGLPTYDAGGGVRSVGAGAQAIYRFNPQWAVHGFVEYDRLVGDAADSPVVKLRGSEDQFTIGGGVAYSFDWVR